jgi:RNA polymerase sigma-70 factor, ECF subfamily
VDNDVDQALVARYRDGDREAFAELVVRYQRPIYNAAFWILRSADDARDVAQDVFLRVAEHLDEFDGQHRFFSWIYRIAVNECLNLKRARRVHEPVTEALEAGSPLRDALETDELSVIVRKALAELTSEQREVVILKYFADLSYGEISQTLGVPEKTIKSRLFEARQRLGARLGTSRGHTR